MATIIQIPDSLSLLRNLKDFIIGSATEVSFRLVCGSEQILEETYYPDSDQRVEIGVQDVVCRFLTIALPDSDIFVQGGAVNTFKAYINGSLAATFTVLASGVRKLSVTPSDFLKTNWLTWQPQTKLTTWDAPEYLSYYFAQAAVVKAKFYRKDGTTKTVTLDSQGAGSMVTYNTRLSRLFGLSGEKVSDLYGMVDVWVETSSGTRLSYIQRYIWQQTSGDEHYYLCVNSLGGIDTFTFRGMLSLGSDIAHEIAESGPTKVDITSDIDREWEQVSGYVGMKEMKWIFELIASPLSWAVLDGAAEKIIVNRDSLQVDDRNNLHSCTFSFILAEGGRLMNLSRSEGDMATMEIPTPTGELFFLKARAADLPDADLEDQLLFLIQSPYSEAWSKASLGAIREWVFGLLQASSIGLAAHSHDNQSVLDRFSDESGKPTYNGQILATESSLQGQSLAIQEIVDSLDWFLPETYEVDGETRHRLRLNPKYEGMYADGWVSAGGLSTASGGQGSAGGGSLVSGLGDLYDVDLGSTIQPGQALVWDGASWTNGAVLPDLSAYEKVANRVTAITAASTDSQYPTAKAVFDVISALNVSGIKYALSSTVGGSALYADSLRDPAYYTTGTGRRTSANVCFSDGGLHHYIATSSMTEGKPSVDAHIIHSSWDSGYWEAQLAIPNNQSQPIQWRTQFGQSAWNDRPWVSLLDSNNSELGAQVNKIETIRLNGEDLAISNKAVNVAAIPPRWYVLGTIAATSMLRLDHSLLDNSLYAMDKRFKVTLDGFSTKDPSTLFNGSYNNYTVSVEAGQTGTILIEADSGYFSTYTHGCLYIGFYIESSRALPESVTARMYGRVGSTYDWYDMTNEGRVALGNTNIGSVYRFYLSRIIYGSKLEITITAPSNKRTTVAEIDYVYNRCSVSDKSVVTKFSVAQDLYGALTAPKLIVRGGTASQFMKADGSLDSRVFALGDSSGVAISAAKLATARNITIADSDATNTGTAVSFDGSAAVRLLLPSTIKASLTGNASTATALQTARTLWGQAFDGTSNIAGDLSTVGRINLVPQELPSNSGNTIEVVNVGTADNPLYALHSTLPFYSDGFVSAGGLSGTAGGSGSLTAALGDLTDVDLGTPSQGQVLKYNGSWYNGSLSLRELSDVASDPPASGQVLSYDSSLGRWTATDIGIRGGRVFFGSCNTGRNTAAKTATCSGFTSDDLTDGTVLLVLMLNPSATETATLDVNSTGAIPISSHSTSASYGYSLYGAWYGMDIVQLVYSGGVWYFGGIHRGDIGGSGTYSAGSGLSLSGTTFSLKQSTWTTLGGGMANGYNLSYDAITSSMLDAGYVKRPVCISSDGKYFVTVPVSSGSGSGGSGSTVSVDPALSSGTRIANITIDGVTTSLYAPGASAGSSVSISPALSSGTRIADITVDGVTTSLFAPEASGGTGASPATASTYGTVKVALVNGQSYTINSLTKTSGRFYGVEMGSDGKLFVNVPWTDTISDGSENGSIDLSGYAKKTDLGAYLPLTGGTMSGAILSEQVKPKSDAEYNLGDPACYWNFAYMKRIYLAAGVYLEYDDTNKCVRVYGAGVVSDSYVSAGGVSNT